MPLKAKARITGLGSYLPEQILTNQDLEKIVETSDEWIFSRTGIKERRIAGLQEFTSDMGVKAAHKALEAAGLAVTQIDLILVATMTPDYISPSTAALIQGALGAKQAAAFDLQAACAGYLYGLSMAKAYIESGMYQNILFISTEKLSSFIDYKDRSTCVLFGDGASAAVISNKGAGFEINQVCLGCDGSLSELLYIPGGGSRNPASLATLEQGLHYLKMNGKEIFKYAVRQMQASALECLQKSGLALDSISWLIPHQANVRIIDAIAKNLNIPDEKVYKTVHKYGNTSAASLAIALDELVQEASINSGEHLLLVAFGAGLTWGATILTKCDG